MKKMIFSTVLLSTIVLGAGSQVLAAETVEVIPNENLTIDSISKVTLKGGDETPTDPEIENPDPGITKQKGPLSLDQVIVFNFQNQDLGSATLNIPFKNVAKPSRLQITDKRGTAVGWRLNAEISDFKSGENGPTLKGVELFFPQVANWTTGNETIPDGTTPTTVGVDKMTPETTELKGVSIKPGVENKKTILNAAKNQGSGRWNVEYSTVGEKKNLPIYLKIPSGNQVGSYTASLTYSLEDAPIGE